METGQVLAREVRQEAPVCLGGCSATSLHAAMQGVLVGWQSFVPLALHGAGHSPGGGCFVSQKSVLISPCKYQLVRVQIRIGALVVWSVPHWRCVAGQSSLELGLLDLPSVAATMVCPGTDRMGLWQLDAFWLSRVGGRKGYASGTEGNDVRGAGGALGAVPGQGLPSTVVSTPRALPGCSRCSSGCCCGPSICCQALEAPTGVEREACRGGESHLEPTGLAGGRCCVAGQETLSLCAWVSVRSLFRFVCREVREVVAALGPQLVLVVGSDCSCQLWELSFVPLHCGANREMSPCWHAGLLCL